MRRGGGRRASFISTKAFDSTLNGGATMTPATTVWGDVDHLKKYDLVILSCEGALNEDDKPAAALKAMYDYESLGGRVFASHWHRYWFSNGPAPVPTIATWRDVAPDPPSPSVGTIDTSFPKGQALAEWLVNVGASMTAGQLSISDGRENVQAVNATLARQWITIPSARRRERWRRDPTRSSNTYRSMLRSVSPRPSNVVARSSTICTCRHRAKPAKTPPGNRSRRVARCAISPRKRRPSNFCCSISPRACNPTTRSPSPRRSTRRNPQRGRADQRGARSSKSRLPMSPGK